MPRCKLRFAKSRSPGGPILGSDEFTKEVEKKIVGLDRPIRKPSLQEILMAVKEATGISMEEIASRVRNKQVVLAREVLVGVWREYGYKLLDLTPTVKRDLSVLSRLSKGSDRDRVRKTVDKVIKYLDAYMQTCPACPSHPSRNCKIHPCAPGSNSRTALRLDPPLIRPWT